MKRFHLKLRALSAAGVFAAAVILVCANIVVNRFYARWDWTSSGLYTLSQATLETLHSLVPEGDDVETPVGTEGEVGRPLELPEGFALPSELSEPAAAAVEDLDAVVVEVRDEHAVAGSYRHSHRDRISRALTR